MQAADLQRQLAGKVKFTPIKTTPKFVAGLDCTFSKDGKKIVAAAVVLDISTLELVETATAIQKITFPYIPGLLSFREAPACLAAAKKLCITPDIFIIDGQGIAHPRRLGIAAHLGLFFNKPTIGCAKSRLIGDFEEPAASKGAYSILKDKNEIIGAVVRTRNRIKPVFISPGNLCTLNDAIKWVLYFATRYRLPEPARIAHQTVTKLKLSLYK